MTSKEKKRIRDNDDLMRVWQNATVAVGAADRRLTDARQSLGNSNIPDDFWDLIEKSRFELMTAQSELDSILAQKGKTDTWTQPKKPPR